jgi:hypothetical protein
MEALNSSYAGQRVLYSTNSGSWGVGDNDTYWTWSDVEDGWLDLGTYPADSVARQANGRFEVLARDDARHPGDLWLVGLDDGEPLLAATDVSSPWLTHTDRVVWSTKNPLLPMSFGDLFVAEVGDDRRWLLDDHARLVSWPTASYDLDGDVLYTVADGERTGLWRSALP